MGILDRIMELIFGRFWKARSACESGHYAKKGSFAKARSRRRRLYPLRKFGLRGTIKADAPPATSSRATPPSSGRPVRDPERSGVFSRKLLFHEKRTLIAAQNTTETAPRRS
jgi:hypothetical protein